MSPTRVRKATHKRQRTRKKTSAKTFASTRRTQVLQTSSSPQKVALLFLTRADHEQPKLWHTFLRGHRHQFSVYCHPANPAHIAHHSFLRRTPNSSAQEGLLPADQCIPKRNNRWAHLTLAYYQLLHHAFHDTANNNQRFVYVSETCVPCVPANTAYQQLTQDLSVTYMDAPQPNDNADRYDHTVMKPRRNAFPENESLVGPGPQSCASLLEKSGILREHFFKHSGWFSPNRRDATRLLQHKDAFQALNMISAGDEHVLAILKRTEYAKDSTLKNKRITYVQWDHDKMAQRREKEANENSGYWRYMDELKQNNPKKHYALQKRRRQLKQANMHPIQYNHNIPNRVLAQCKQANSLFLRKVRRSCNTHNIHKLLLTVDKSR